MKHILSDCEGKHLIKHAYEHVIVENKVTHTVHFSGCCAEKRIAANNRNTLSELPENHKLCTLCKSKLIISLAAVEQNPTFDDYISFFQRCDISLTFLKELFLRQKTYMSMLSENVILFKVADDFWKIVAFNDGSLCLMHNNYIWKNGKRIFNSGFHRQLRTMPQNANILLQKMYSYIVGEHKCIAPRKAQLQITPPSNKHGGPPTWSELPIVYRESIRYKRRKPPKFK